ncbi:MAG TPA: NAD(P)H-binding protein [Vicinamibacterales bacterium]|nr:NAD(P)H-binding protein [Vicinamibacterales bacterium]
MIVVTTPTGQLGRQVLAGLVDRGEAVRAIARDPSRLDVGVRDRVQAVQGSHDDPAVLDTALKGAEGLFWLVPPDPTATTAEAHYLGFARPTAAALRRHGVARVVGVSSAGYGWPVRAGILSAAFAMDAEIERSGAAYRALSMPFFMENLLRQLDAIRDHGVFSLPNAADRPLATVAIRDIAATALALLADRLWDGQENLPVFGPDRLSPREMAEVISDVVGRPVSFRQLSIAEVVSGLVQCGASEGTVRDLAEAIAAGNDGIYDADQTASTPTPTDFRTWCRDVLRPALLA